MYMYVYVYIYIYVYVTGVTQLTGSPRPDHLLGLKEIPNVWFLSHSSKRSFQR